MNKALVLIDFEKEWIDKDSDYYVGDISEVVLKVNKLINFARKNNYKIIWTRHVEEDSDYSFKAGSPNVDFISELDFGDGDIVVEKYRISPFLKTGMEENLQGVEEVVVCGILTNLCVRSFVEGAYDRDINIKIIKDCCVSFDDETQEFTLKDIKNTREEVEIFSLRDFMNI